MESLREKLSRSIREGDPTALSAMAHEAKRSGQFGIVAIDDVIGPSFQLFNLPINGEKYHLIAGRKRASNLDDRTPIHIYPPGDSRPPVPLPPLPPWPIDFEHYNPDAQKHGACMMSTLIYGSICRELYALRNDRHLGQFATLHAQDRANRPFMTGSIAYEPAEDGLRLWDISIDRTLVSRPVHVPTPTTRDRYEIGYTLAPLQGIHEGSIADLPSELTPLLTELFGQDYLRVIPALQYFAGPNKNGALPELFLEIGRNHASSSHGRRFVCIGTPWGDTKISVDSEWELSPILLWKNAQKAD